MEDTIIDFLEDSLFSKEEPSNNFSNNNSTSPSLNADSFMFNQESIPQTMPAFSTDASLQTINPLDLSSSYSPNFYNIIPEVPFQQLAQPPATDDYKAQQIAHLISELLQQNSKVDFPISQQQQQQQQQPFVPQDTSLPLLVPKQEITPQNHFPYIENLYPNPAINPTSFLPLPNTFNNSVPNSTEKLSTLKPKLMPLQPATNLADLQTPSLNIKPSKTSVQKNILKIRSPENTYNDSLTHSPNNYNNLDFHLSDMSTTESKKFKNMISARKFRMRKKEYVTDLESRFKTVCSEKDALEKENNTLKSLVADLKKQIESLSISKKSNSSEALSSDSQSPASSSSSSSSSNITASSSSSSSLVKFNPHKDVSKDSIKKNNWNSNNNYIVVNSCFVNYNQQSSYHTPSPLDGTAPNNLNSLLESTFGKILLPSKNTIFDLINIAITIAFHKNLEEYLCSSLVNCISSSNPPHLYT
ncbi:hypothetical protein AYI70_g11452 [Smittium culicis]|uniref:BZIP domain-containing protein n=1 Tax=Smittium culicis TaxID=133412 RepID=A0A1R1X1R7_9FUNG|nr:hypothetical protein AYI70_g11452 [Smittium culicis]